MKRFLPILLALALLLPLGGCGLFGGDDEEEAPVPLDLLGEWKQSNSPSDADYQGILITEDGIDVYWILGTSKGAALYWSGSFTPPPEGSTEKDTYTWKSEANTSRTALSALTNKSKSMEFTYENGKITYKVKYDDEMTMPVVARKENWSEEISEYQGSIDIYDLLNEQFQQMMESGE